MTISTKELKERSRKLNINCPGDLQAALGLGRSAANAVWNGGRPVTDRTLNRLRDAEEGLPGRACSWLERRLLHTADKPNDRIFEPATLSAYDIRDWQPIVDRLVKDGLAKRDARGYPRITAKGFRTIQFYRKMKAKGAQ